MKLNVPPCGLTGLVVPESNVLPSSLVTVWAATVVFFHMTVVPTGMVNLAGLKAKFPLLSVMIVTVIVGPLMAAVVVDVVLSPLPYPYPYPLVVVDVMPANVFVIAVSAAVDPVLVLLPQAASRTTAPSASRQNKLHVEYIVRSFLVIAFFLFLNAVTAIRTQPSIIAYGAELQLWAVYVYG